MIRRLDRMWFRLLASVYRRVVRGVEAHARREKLRRFRRQLEWQRTDLN
jgi:hypothetical protein